MDALRAAQQTVSDTFL